MERKLILPVLVLICMAAAGQTNVNSRRLDYFQQYGELAMEEMSRSGVPASITLAQGALESGDGMSRLAVQANNHFGIKCHDDWYGRTIKHDDDRNNECFRRYGSVEESFRDHSDFLNEKPRYASLFELEPTDYKGWAKGLKRAGYATSPGYDNALIRIIEDYNLQQYDLLALNERNFGLSAGAGLASLSTHPVLENNRVKYVVAKAGDTFQTLASEMDKLEWELPRYNELTPYDSLSEGQVIYVQPKRKKAEAGKKTHVMRAGESMYDISQLYAVKLDFLHEMNQIPYGTEPQAGAVLQLRKAVRNSSAVPMAIEPVMETEGDPVLEFDLGL